MDKSWFPPEHLADLEKQFQQPNPQADTVFIPENVEIKTEKVIHHYQFKGGIPFHGFIPRNIPAYSKLILFKRKPNEKS